jgi:hypothetical protein
LRLCTILILSALLCGCQSSLTPKEAETIISTNAFFQGAQYFDVPVTVDSTSCSVYGNDKPGWRQMIDLGFATARDNGSGQCTLDLSDAGRRASVLWKTENGVWKVPIATKTFLRIERINYGLGATTGVTFIWHWTPTPFGQRLPSSTNSLEKNVAQCSSSQSGWRVESIQ